VAGPGLLGQGGLDPQGGAAQLGRPVGLLGGAQVREPVGHGGAGVGQAAVPQGGLGQGGEHRRGVLRVQRRRGLVEDVAEIGLGAGQVAAAQPVQLHPLGPAAAVQLGQERAQRVAAVQLVGPVGQDQGDPAAQVADQEPEQVAGGLVGPVEVRHHHGGGPAGRRPLERRPELGDLGVAADQHRTGDSLGNVVDDPRSGRRRFPPAGRACFDPVPATRVSSPDRDRVEVVSRRPRGLAVTVA
jgi:hypothetical protein